jgi:N-acetylglucosamine-6-phosphate deacetylase
VSAEPGPPGPPGRRIALRAARLATPSALFEPGWLILRNGAVEAVGAGGAPAGAEVVDLGDRILAPGFVDLHVHGGDGAQVNAPSSAEVSGSLATMASFHARHGTTSLVATTVADTPQALLTAVEAVAAAVRAGRGTRPIAAEILGTHLEGPWLSPARAGAQAPGALRLPDLAELERLIAHSDGTIRILTIAPELPGAADVVTAARAAGIVVSVGHTDADFETTRRAFDDGARHVTHLFNTMPPMHHRRPGPVAAALADPRVSLEVIADGVHLDPVIIHLAALLAGDRLVLVSDATPAAGLAPGRQVLGPIEVIVSGRRVALAGDPATIAGSVLTLDEAVAFTVKEASVPLLTALRAATLTPANVVGAGRKGRIEPGADADLVVLDPDLTLRATVVGGRVAHDPCGLLAVLAPAPPGAGGATGEGAATGA